MLMVAFHLAGIPAAHLRQMTRRFHTSGSPRPGPSHSLLPILPIIPIIPIQLQL